MHDFQSVFSDVNQMQTVNTDVYKSPNEYRMSRRTPLIVYVRSMKQFPCFSTRISRKSKFTYSPVGEVKSKQCTLYAPDSLCAHRDIESIYKITIILGTHSEYFFAYDGGTEFHELHIIDWKNIDTWIPGIAFSIYTSLWEELFLDPILNIICFHFNLNEPHPLRFLSFLASPFIQWFPLLWSKLSDQLAQKHPGAMYVERIQVFQRKIPGIVVKWKRFTLKYYLLSQFDCSEYQINTDYPLAFRSFPYQPFFFNRNQLPCLFYTQRDWLTHLSAVSA